MLHGKAGFERLARAAREVLNHSVSWLFYDLSNQSDSPGPILKHHPLRQQTERQTFPKQRVSCIDLCSLSVESLREPSNATGIYEWLSMISLDSPRLDRLDKVDPYLSRYEIPECLDAVDGTASAPESPSRLLMRVLWRGFLPPQLLTKIWLMVRDCVGDDWAAMSVGCFGNEAYTALEIGHNGTLVWEVGDKSG
jgi:ribonucleases P/MRP protein subunit RPP40